MAYECTFHEYSLILNNMGWFMAHVMSRVPRIHGQMYRSAGPPITLDISSDLQYTQRYPYG